MQAADLRVALDQVVLDSMPTVLLGMGALYAFFAVAHVFLLPPAMARVMSPLAAASALVMLGLRSVLGRWSISARWAHPIGALVAAFVLLDSLTQLYLASDLLQTTDLLLLIVGAGFLLLSARWLALVIGMSLVSWGVCIWALPPSSMWQHFAFALLSAIVLSVVVHVAHVRAMRRLESLRIRDEFQKTRLEMALASTEKARRALETNIAVGQRIASILDLDSLLTEVAEIIKERFGYDYVGIFMVDEGGTYLTARAGTGDAGRALREKGFRLQVGQEGVIGWVAHSRRSARVDDISKDSRFVSMEVLPHTQSELALPLTMGKSVLGVLDIQSDRLAAFGKEDVPVIQSLADQVAIAIQNASLYQGEQTRRRLSETLYRVGNVLSGTLDPKEVLALILEYMAEIVHYDRASILLPSASGEAMEFAAFRGFPPGATPHMRILIKDNDIYEQIYRTRQPLLIPEVSEWPGWQYAEGLREARAWLGVPLIRLDQVVGMLSLARETPTPYNDDEVNLAITFAGQAAVALENARLYDQLSRAYDQLERLDRTKSDFISVVAHELRTPLTVLRGSSQMLLDDQAIKGNEYHHQLVSSVNAGAIRLHEIVNAMLDMTKIDSHTLQLYLEPVSVPMQIRMVCDSLQEALLERKLALHVEDMSDLPEIKADADLLRKAFYQLIVNAIKYTPDGGQITVSGRRLTGGQKDMPEEGVEIIFSDTGIGIDPQFHQLIFTKFYQTGEVALHSTSKTKFKGGGPGLGLAIAKGIIEAHGGKLWVDSPGCDEKTCPGSHFHVALPLQPIVTPAAPPSAER